MQCPGCRHENGPSAKFCEECGARLSRACATCGAALSPAANFCPECGEPSTRPAGGVRSRVSLESQFAAIQTTRPALAAELTGVPIEAETRLLTILFADLSSSVQMTRDLDPEETAEFLDKVLKVMLDATLRYDGRINSILGDGVLAFFGTPHAREDDAERAIRTALEIRDGLRDLGLDATAGISTGEVYLGRVGTEQHQEFAARGHPINLAARLQGKAAPGQILVSETTYRLSRHSFQFSPLTLDLKGVSEPVRVCEVIDAFPKPEKPRGIEGLRAELHGRDAELGRLKQALDDVMERRGAAVTIIGEAGVGKSRLVEELRADVRARAGNPLSPLWLEGRCLETGAATGYLPYRDVFRDYFRFQPGDDDREHEGRVASAVAALADQGELTEERAEEIVPFLALLLSVSLSPARARRLSGLGPEQVKNRTFTAVRDVLIAIARHRPLVLVLEDLHWADTLSFDLTVFLLDALASTPLLLLCLSRPEPEHRWRRFTALASEKCGAAQELHLRELSAEASRRLLHALLPIEDLPKGMRDIILSRAQGNPFFLEEVLRSFVDAGILYRHEGTWHVREQIQPVTVPESVQAVILSRVDRLSDEERHLLQTAAVVGRTFRRSLLARLWPDTDALERVLWELERRQLVFKERSIAEERYSFKHILTQETIYRSILRRRRAQLHRQIADAIEALALGSLEADYEALAYHYERSTDPEKAVEYLILAGEKSHGTFLNEAAIDYFQRALSRLGGLAAGSALPAWRTEMKTRAHEGLGDVLRLSGKHEEAVASFDRALELQGEGVMSARLYRKIGKSFQVRRRAEDAFRAFDLAEAVLGKDPAGPTDDWWHERIELFLDRALLAYFMAPVSRLDANIEAAGRLVEAHGTPAQRTNLLHIRALAALRRRRYIADAETVGMARAAAEASVLMNPAEIGMTRFIHGFALLWADRLDEAEAELLGTLEGAERVGDVTLQSRCLTYLTLLYRKRGEMEEVRRWAARTLKVAEAGGMIEYIAQAQANLAWAAWRTRDIAEFERLAASAWDLWQTLPRPGPYVALAFIAEWPEFARELSRGHISEALDHARALIGPDLQPTPDHLTAALRDAVTAQTPEAACPLLERAAEIAARYGYL
jgi:class 3 adenylate cyclase/tetratricopeptide (TPR) repeat protein